MSSRLRDHARIAYLAGILGIILVVAVAMFRGLRASFWFDEAVTATTVTRGISGTIGILGNADGGFAGYSILLSLWASPGWDSELWLRLPSLVAVLVTIGLAAELGRRLAGPLCGLTTAALLAVNPQLVGEYASEARPYALAVALVTLIALIAARASRTGFTLWSLVSVGLLVALVATIHMLSIVAVAMLTPWFLAALRTTSWTKPVRIAAVACGALDLAAIAVMAGLAAKYSDLQSWISNPSPYEWAQMVVTTATIGVLGCGAVAAVWCAVLRRRAAGEHRVESDGENRVESDGENRVESDGEERGGTDVLAAAATPRTVRRVDIISLGLWAMGPLVLLAAAGYLYRPMLQSRYVLSSTVAWTLLAAIVVSLAWSWARTRVTRTAIAVSTVIVAVLGSILVLGGLQPSGKGDDPRAAAAWIGANQQPGDGLLYYPTWVEPAVRWYLSEATYAVRPTGGPSPVVAGDESADDADSPWTPARAGLAENTSRGDAERAQIIDVYDRIWVVTDPAKEGGPWEPVPEVATDLVEMIRDHWDVVTERDFEGTRVTLYERRE